MDNNMRATTPKVLDTDRAAESLRDMLRATAPQLPLGEVLNMGNRIAVCLALLDGSMTVQHNTVTLTDADK